MSKSTRDHYIPRFILRGFAERSDNEKYKTHRVDIENGDIGKLNVESVFYEKNLYDSDEGNKKLEHMLDTNLEHHVGKYLSELERNPEKIVLTRKQLYLLKKYALLQCYRTPTNKDDYTIPKSDIPNSESLYVEENGYGWNNWREEMEIILKAKDWEELLNSENFAVKSNVSDFQSQFVMFIKTPGEFIINDVGCMSECFQRPVPPMQNVEENVTRISDSFSLEFSPNDAFNKELIRKCKETNFHSYENFSLFPLRPNLALLIVGKEWMDYRIIENMNIKSKILDRYLVGPKREYVNGTDENGNLISKSDNDRYIYTVKEVTREDTKYINSLLLNETQRYFAFKTPTELFKSIRYYNRNKTEINNISHNLNHVEKALKEMLISEINGYH